MRKVILLIWLVSIVVGCRPRMIFYLPLYDQYERKAPDSYHFANKIDGLSLDLRVNAWMRHIDRISLDLVVSNNRYIDAQYDLSQIRILHQDSELKFEMAIIDGARTRNSMDLVIRNIAAQAEDTISYVVSYDPKNEIPQQIELILGSIVFGEAGEKISFGSIYFRLEE